MLLPIGFAYFAVYYVLFNFAIKKFNLMTLGRELVEAPTTAETSAPIPAPVAVPAQPIPSSTPSTIHPAQTEQTVVSEAKTTKDQQRIIDYVAAWVGNPNLTSVDA